MNTPTAQDLFARHLTYSLAQVASAIVCGDDDEAATLSRLLRDASLDRLHCSHPITPESAVGGTAVIRYLDAAEGQRKPYAPTARAVSAYRVPLELN